MATARAATPRHALPPAPRPSKSRPKSALDRPLEGPPGPARRRIDLIVALGLVTLVLALGLATAAVRPTLHAYGSGMRFKAPLTTSGEPTWQPTALPTTLPTPADQAGRGTYDHDPQADTELVWRWIVLGAVVLAGGIVVLVRWYRGREIGGTPAEVVAVDTVAEPQIPTLQRGAEAASQRLAGDADPTDAIIGAWLDLESAAAASGVARSPAETPTEFTAAVLRRTGAEAEPVQTLLRLYHRARFAASGSRPDDLAAARRCVAELAESWRAFEPDTAGRR